jgi:hypothetical protein
MGTWQPAGAQGQGAVNGKDSVANDENTFENAPLQLFSLGQLPKRTVVAISQTVAAEMKISVS